MIEEQDLCRPKPIREEELKKSFTQSVLERVLQRHRLKTLLADVLDRSGTAEEKRRAYVRFLVLEVTAGDDQIAIGGT